MDSEKTSQPTEVSASAESPGVEPDTSPIATAPTAELPQDEEARDDAVLEELDAIEMDDTRGGQRPIAVIFASVAGFEPPHGATQDDIEDIAVRQNEFNSALDHIITQYGGVIDKIIRGFFMATFGTQTASKDDPALTVLSAVEMTEAADKYGAEVHVGVNCGMAWVGQIKTERTIDTTVIGDTVNLSARLKTKAGHNEVVVSSAAYEATKDYFEYESLPPVTVKGISQPVPIYAVRGRKEKVRELQASRVNDEARLKLLQEQIPEYLREKIKNSSGRLQGERKLVTMLYSDVSGFTALSEKYKTQPELIAEVMNRCHKRLGDIIYKYEGVIDKIVGDELMAMFGAPIIHEDDPERAVWCAIEMQDEMARFSAETEEEMKVPPLTVHIGVNTGRVSIGNIQPGTMRMDYTVVGEPVELAEVLEDISEGGETIVGERTYRLTRALIEYKEHSRPIVGGKEMPVYLVLGKKDITESKRGLSHAVGVPMVGREYQYEQATASVNHVLDKQGQVITVIGEAGFGKSRLKREVHTIFDTYNGVWIEGACYPNTVNVGYSIFLRAFEDYFGLKENDPREVRREKLENKFESVFEGNSRSIEEIMPYIANMLSIPLEGAMAEKIAFLDPEQLQRRTFVAVRDLFQHIAQTRPLVLALDDLHWLDNVSNNLIYFLLEYVREIPMLFFLIYRPERRDLCWQIGETAEEKYADRYQKVEILPLERGPFKQLIDFIMPMGPEGEPLKEILLDKAGGNPFYLEEFIRVLLDDDFIEHKEGVWILKRDIADFRVPDTLEQMLSARIDKLDDDSKDVLQSASVIGRQFDHETLKHIVQEDEEHMDKALSYLTDLDFIHEEKPDPVEYVFGHIITYEISYSAVISTRRRELHRRVGDSIEEAHPGDLDRFMELLAHHFCESTDRPKAIHYSGRAGSKARRMFNNADAVTFYERGLTIAGQVPDANPDDLLEILEGLGDVYPILGRFEDAVNTLTRAHEMVDQPFRRAVFQRKMGGVYTKWSHYPDAEERLNLALETLDGVEAAEGLNEEKARIYDMRGSVAYERSDFPTALDVCQRALSLVENSRALDILCSVYKNLGRTGQRMGNVEMAMTYCQRGIEIAERIGDKLLMSELYNNLGVMNRAQAKTDDAISNIRQSIELKEHMGYAGGLSNSYLTLGTLLRQKGELETALSLLEKGLEIARKIGAKQNIASAMNILGAFYGFRKQYDTAVEYYQQGLQFSRESGARQLEVAALFNLSDAYLSLNRLEEAEVHLRQTETLARELNIAVVITKASTGLGDLCRKQERYEEALEHYTSALDSAVRAKEAPVQAEINRNMGDVYLALKDNEKAREHLTKAVELYTQLGSAQQAADIQARIP